MQAFFVASEEADGLYGSYSRPVADRVLKIIRMASDETAELEVAEVDMFGEQLQSGLLPFKVCVVVQQGKVQDVEVSLCWPPVPEGMLVEREDYREYFVWARNQSEAKTRLASLPKSQNACEAEGVRMDES
ncbi:MAG: hypothetical protein WCW68_00125 [Methanothrix sp.]|jgi:hypothetical protein